MNCDWRLEDLFLAPFLSELMVTAYYTMLFLIRNEWPIAFLDGLF